MGTRCIEPGDPEYPASVARLAGAAPWCRGAAPRLFVRGALPRPPAVALVGSRRVAPAVAQYGRALAATLARAGFTIVSGGAVGVDRAAHEGALEAGAPTVVVTAGGLDKPYPAAHADLFHRVLAGGGGLVSLEADGAEPLRPMFLRRNRVMVAMCVAAVVVQARLRSGSLAAAGAARALGVPVYFVPASPWEAASLGSLRQLQAGARPLWHLEDAPAILAQHVPPELEGAAPAVLRLLGARPMHIDEIVMRAGVPIADLREALLMLTLEGLALEGPPAHYTRR